MSASKQRQPKRGSSGGGRTPQPAAAAAASSASSSRSAPWKARGRRSAGSPPVDSDGVPLSGPEQLVELSETYMRQQMALGKFRSTEGWPRIYHTFKLQLDQTDVAVERRWDKHTAENLSTCWSCEDVGDPEVICCDGICQRSFHLDCCGESEIPEGAWFCPQCAEADFPEPHCNDHDPVRRSVLLCAIEDHKLRDHPDDEDAPKHAYLTYLLHTPRLEHKLHVNLCDKERGFNALHYGMIVHNQLPPDVIIRLLELGCDANRHAKPGKPDWGATPAHVALQQQEASLFLPLLTSPFIDLKAMCGGSGVFVKTNPFNDVRGRRFKTDTWPIFVAFTLIFVLREHFLHRKRSPSDAQPTADLDEAESEESLGYSFPAFIREKLRALDLKPLQFAYLMLLNPREGKTFSALTFKESVARALENERIRQRVPAEEPAEPGPFEGVAQKALHGRVVDALMALVQQQHERQQQRFATAETKERVRIGIGSYARWTRAWEHINGRSAPGDSDVESEEGVAVKAERRPKGNANSSSSAAAAAAMAAAVATAAAAAANASDEEEDEDEAEQPEHKQAVCPRRRHRKPLPPSSNRSARSRGPIEAPPADPQSPISDDNAEDDDAGFQPDYEDAQMQSILSPVPVLPPPPAYAPVAPPSPAPPAPAAHSRKRRADVVDSASPVPPVLQASADRSVSAASKRAKSASSSSPPLLPPLVAAPVAVAPMRASSAASQGSRAEEKSPVAPGSASSSDVVAAMVAANQATAQYLACIPDLFKQTQVYRQFLARPVHSAADVAAIESALSSDVSAAASTALDDLTRVQQQHRKARQQLQQRINQDQREPGSNAAGGRRWADSSHSMSVDSHPANE